MTYPEGSHSAACCAQLAQLTDDLHHPGARDPLVFAEPGSDFVCELSGLLSAIFGMEKH